MPQIMPATDKLSKYARTVGVPGKITRDEEGFTLIDGQRRTPLGRTRADAQRRLECLNDPHACWAVQEGTYGRTTTSLGKFKVGDRVRIVEDADDEQGNVAEAGETGEITQILDKAKCPYFVEIDGAGEVPVGLWMFAEEIEPE